MTIPFFCALQAFPRVVWKKMGSFGGEEGGGQGGTTNPRMEISYSFRGLFQSIYGLAAGFIAGELEPEKEILPFQGKWEI